MSTDREFVEIVDEEWMPVVGYEDHYEVSTHGRVRRVAPNQGTRTGYLLKLIENDKGYFKVNLNHVGRPRKAMYVHRLVAAAFSGPNDEMLVRHIDGDPSNNHLSNIRFGTPFENAADRIAHGRSAMNNRNRAKTHCARGHEFTPENTATRERPGGKISRRCITCRREERQRAA